MDTISTLWELDTLERVKDYLADSADTLRLQNFIDNQFFAHLESERWIESFNPSSGDVLVHVPRSTPPDVDRAVDAASRAFPSWSQTSRTERSNILLQIAAILSENKELFAVWESIDQGKTLSRARVEVDRAISNFRLVSPISRFGSCKMILMLSEPDTLQRISYMTRAQCTLPMATVHPP